MTERATLKATWAPFASELYSHSLPTPEPNAPVEKFIGWESLLTVLTTTAFYALLPEIREWLKLTSITSALLREKIANRLKAWAKEKELDYPKAEKAADRIASKLDVQFFKRFFDALEKAKAQEAENAKTTPDSH